MSISNPTVARTRRPPATTSLDCSIRIHRSSTTKKVVVFARPIVANDTQNKARVTVRNATGSTAYLSGWIDFNRDGDWNDTGEKILSDISVTTGRVDHTFTGSVDRSTGQHLRSFQIVANT